MLRLLTGALVLALTAPALAEQPSYNYLGVGYQRVEIDVGLGSDIDGDGFGINGSFEVAENWHIGGGYATTGFDFGVDLNQLAIGGGYHTAISDTTSFFADLLWVSVEIDTGVVGSVDESGAGIAIGVRSNISDALELAGSLAYTDLGDGADGTTVAGSAWYRLNETVAIGLGASFEEDVVGYGLSARLYFE